MRFISTLEYHASPECMGAEFDRDSFLWTFERSYYPYVPR